VKKILKFMKNRYCRKSDTGVTYCVLGAMAEAAKCPVDLTQLTDPEDEGEWSMDMGIEDEHDSIVKLRECLMQKYKVTESWLNALQSKNDRGLWSSVSEMLEEAKILDKLEPYATEVEEIKE